MASGTTLMASLTLVTASGDAAMTGIANLLVANYVTALGVTTTIHAYPPDQLLQVLATGAFDMALLTRNDGADPDSLRTLIQSDQIPFGPHTAGQNYAGIDDMNIDAQLAKGRTTLDYSRRVQIYQNLQKYLTAQCDVQPLFIRSDISLARMDIGNFFQHPEYGDLWNTADWYMAN